MIVVELRDLRALETFCGRLYKRSTIFPHSLYTGTRHYSVSPQIYKDHTGTASMTVYCVSLMTLPIEIRKKKRIH